MPLFISSLNSGSNGNCYYIGNHQEAVLIDAGIACRETEKRMKRLGLSLSTVRAVFISHEHSDHITGIPILSRKYQLPVYITADTLSSGGIRIEHHLTRFFSQDHPVHIGGLTITPFPKFHDASDPHSFMVSGGDVNIGIFTDIGHCCEQVKGYFKQCHAAFLESNYCEAMLMNGRYPKHLKKRISSDKGHLSNTQAVNLFMQHKGPQLSHLILSHLSANNNRPELVERLFSEKAGYTRIIVASRYRESAVYCIEKGAYETGKLQQPYYPSTQLTLALG